MELRYDPLHGHSILPAGSVGRVETCAQVCVLPMLHTPRGSILTANGIVYRATHATFRLVIFIKTVFIDFTWELSGGTGKYIHFSSH